MTCFQQFNSVSTKSSRCALTAIRLTRLAFWSIIAVVGMRGKFWTPPQKKKKKKNRSFQTIIFAWKFLGLKRSRPTNESKSVTVPFCLFLSFFFFFFFFFAHACESVLICRENWRGGDGMAAVILLGFANRELSFRTTCQGQPQGKMNRVPFFAIRYSPHEQAE